jgi:hypothetical protein
MENEKNNSALTQNDILEGIRTLNAIYSAMMIGSQVAIEKFMEKKKMPHHARKFFISEMAKSLDQMPDVRQQLKLKQLQASQPRKIGGGLLSRMNTMNPMNLVNQKKTVPLSVSTNTSIASLPLDATKSIPVPVGVPVDEMNQNETNEQDSGSAESQKEMEKQAIDAIISGKMLIGKSIFKKIIQVSSNIFERIIDYATGGILNKPPSELAGETNKIVLVLSMVLKDLSTDERQIQAMKDISEALTKTLLDVMDVIAPAVKQIVSKTFDNMSSIGEQGASGSMRVFISAAKAAISEIPIVGGIINLILAFGESFNVFSKIVSTLMSKGSNMSNDVVNAFMQARAKFEESFAKYKRDIETAKRTINTLTTPMQSSSSATVQQSVQKVNETINPEEIQGTSALQKGGKYKNKNKTRKVGRRKHRQYKSKSKSKSKSKTLIKKHKSIKHRNNKHRIHKYKTITTR